MAIENVVTEITEKTAIISINRPENLNALNSKTIEELGLELDGLNKNQNIRVVIITGKGDKAFVAGADIKEFAEYNSEKAEILSKTGQEQLFNKIEQFSKPVIAAINGYALGGGLELALACHIRYASENAKLGLPEVTLGLIPGYGGTQRLPKLVGKGLANEIIFSAKTITAKQAKDMGLVNEVYPQEELMPKCLELAETISKNSPKAISKAINAINASDGETGYEIEIHSFGELFDLEDKKEGVSAFLEKRKPNFK